jgi:hypothetical protein
MTCSDVQRVLPDFLDGEPVARLQPDFQAHMKSCPDCSDLISDLNLITSEARQLSTSDEPAPRVWVRIAAELRAEGIIKDPESAPARPILLPSPPRRRSNAWWLAPVAAAILAAGGYLIGHKTAPITAQLPTQAAPIVSPMPVAVAKQSEGIRQSAVPAAPAPQQVARIANPVPAPVRLELESSPSADDQQFLSVVSTRAPSMRSTYESQLQAVNADIRETQEYVNQNPSDADARQHLMEAYEQKALLYQLALDRIQ